MQPPLLNKPQQFPGMLFIPRVVCGVIVDEGVHQLGGKMVGVGLHQVDLGMGKMREEEKERGVETGWGRGKGRDAEKEGKKIRDASLQTVSEKANSLGPGSIQESLKKKALSIDRCFPNQLTIPFHQAGGAF